MYSSGTQPQSNRNNRLVVSFAVIVFTWFIQFDLTSAAVIQTKSRAEAWVLTKIMADQVADLADPSAKLSHASDRTLRSSFIETLLTDPVHSAIVKRHGIRIENAVFEESMDLSDATISHSLSLHKCLFHKGVDLSRSIIRGNLSFVRSTFKKEGDAKFTFMKLDGRADFGDTEFAGSVDFMGAHIGGQFVADRARFTNVNSGVNFSGMEVRDNAMFLYAVFAGPANFGNTHIGFSYVADNARFTSASHTAIFNGMSVGEMAVFEGTQFAGPVDFTGARIGSQFVADRARFTNVNSEAIFNGMEVSKTAFFRDTEFAGPVDFKLAHIRAHFTADRSKFTNSNQQVRFDGMTVDGRVSFQDTKFNGVVVLADMSYRQIRVKKDIENGWWKSLIEFVDRSSYSTTSYTNLEGSLKRESLQLDFALVIDCESHLCSFCAQAHLTPPHSGLFQPKPCFRLTIG